MVSARMAAVLVLALLLLCGNVQSADESLVGYVTQVKTGVSNESLTTPSTSPGTAPAITSPTEGSDDTRTAVLSAVALKDSNDAMPVDLARADDEKMLSMILAPTPSPSAEAVPEGFDMIEAESPSTIVEADGPVAFGPDSADPAAPGPDLAYSLAAAGEGKLVSDVNDTSFPNISADKDNGYQPGYGVHPMTPPTADSQGASFTTLATQDPAYASEDGKLISDVDDTNYPPVSADKDNGYQPGYGVHPMTPPTADSQGASFTTLATQDPAYASEDGKLISDVDDTNYPPVSADKDNGYQPGYGVHPMTPPTADSQGASFTTLATQDPAYASEDGKLISDVDDTNYPPVSADKDNGYQPGYGVHPMTPPTADSQGASFTTLATQDPAYASEDGKLISDVDDTNYPPVSADKDNGYQPGYGVHPMTPPTADSQGASFTTLATQDPAYASEDGKLISDVDDTNYPPVSADKDNGYQPGYGVHPMTPPTADSQGASFTTLATQDPAYASEDGKLISDVDDTNYPLVKETQDFTGYGVNNPGGEGDKDAATTQVEAGPESGTSETTGVTLSQSHTYTPPPKSATWGRGKCTFYGGMDAAGTMSGACGYGNLYASGYGAYTTALSSALFKNGMSCGACFEVACSGNPKACKPGSVLVTVTNFCPPNPGQSVNNGGWCNGANQHFDLSYPAFAKIADPKAGVVDLNYRRVPCKKIGGIRFTLNGNCNFNLVTITNVGGSGVVSEAYMKGDGMDWAPMSRNWGANWQCSRNYCGEGISIKIVTSDKKVSVSRLAGKDWAFGKTYIGQQVY